MKPKPPVRIDDRRRLAIKADGTTIPVVDAKFSFLVSPSEEDIRNAVPLDHHRCMYCLACMRQFNSELVWVTRTLAYVELKNKGKAQLQRFVLTSPARLNIQDFDAGKDVPPDSVVFAAPKPYQRLDNIRRRFANIKLAEKRKGYAKEHAKEIEEAQAHQAYVKGEISPRKRPKPAGPALRDRASGRFQFFVKTNSDS